MAFPKKERAKMGGRPRAAFLLILFAKKHIMRRILCFLLFENQYVIAYVRLMERSTTV
jgi:hypothetical protein